MNNLVPEMNTYLTNPYIWTVSYTNGFETKISDWCNSVASRACGDKPALRYAESTDNLDLLSARIYHKQI